MIRRTVLAAVALAVASAASASADVSQKEANRWEPNVGPAKHYAQDRAGDVGFAVFDMRGRLSHHGGGGRAVMASTFKVMLMVAYLRQDSVDDRALTNYDKDLIRPMIRRSDNTNATRIRDMLGQGPIESLADRARMKHFKWNSIWGYCKTSARDQAFFMRNLRRYVPNRHWDFARRQLAHIVGSPAVGDRAREPPARLGSLLQGRLGDLERRQPPGRVASQQAPPRRPRRPDRGQSLTRVRHDHPRGRFRAAAPRTAAASAGRPGR